MIVLDVNVLVAAHRPDTDHHAAVARWLRTLPTDESLVVPPAALVGFLRVVTHPRVFPEPTPPAVALAFADRMRGHPAYEEVAAGPEHWRLLGRLVLEHGLVGNDVPDAHLAALALAHDASLATYDTGFERFAGLRTVAPR